MRHLYKFCLHIFSYIFLITTSLSCLLEDEKFFLGGGDEPTPCEELGYTAALESAVHGEFDSLFADGHGTEGEPWIICTVDQLQNMGFDDSLLDKFFELGGDIDASATFNGEDYHFGPEGFIPIGNCGYTFGCVEGGAPFTGSFNGNGFTIFGLFINSDNVLIGLFDAFDTGAVVTDVKFSNVAIGTTYTYTPNDYGYHSIGALVGVVQNSPQIDKIHVDFACIGDLYRCYNSSADMFTRYTGGIMGAIVNGSVSFSQLSVDNSYISSSRNAGGIVGHIYGSSVTLSRVSARGGVYGKSFAGGIVGYSRQDGNNTVIQDAYFAGATSLTFYPDAYGPTAGFIRSNGGPEYSRAAGIVGGSLNNGTIKRAYLGDDVVVIMDNGGLVAGIVGQGGYYVRGLNYYTTPYITLLNNFSAGELFSSTGIAGVVGYTETDTGKFQYYYLADGHGLEASLYHNGTTFIGNNFFMDRPFPPGSSFECGYSEDYGYAASIDGVCEEWEATDEVDGLSGIEGFYSINHAVYDVGTLESPTEHGWEFVGGTPRTVDSDINGEAGKAAWKAMDRTKLPLLNFDP